MWKVRSHLHIGDLLFIVWGVGYFACYVLFSALTKRATGPGTGLSGPAILPVTTLVSLVGAAVFVVATRWWKSARRFSLGGISLPRPGLWPFLSGLCVAAIIGTTTLAFSFDGASIVFMMLWMRGGVLVLAPLTNVITRRRVRRHVWASSALSFAAITLVTVGDTARGLSGWAPVVIAVYVLATFIRPPFMNRMAETEDPERLRGLVEEQMVATSALFLTLIALAIWGEGPGMHVLRLGFTDTLTSGAVGGLILIGVCALGICVFDALIRREHLLSVSFSGVSAIIAGVVADSARSLFADAPPPAGVELLGAGLVIAAMKVISVPQRVELDGPAAPTRFAPTIAPEGPQDASGNGAGGPD